VTRSLTPVLRRGRAVGSLLTVSTQRIVAAIAGEVPVLWCVAAVSTGLLRAKTYLPARRAVPVAQQDRFSFLPLEPTVCTVLCLLCRLVRRAVQIIIVIADAVAAVVVELAAARVLVRYSVAFRT
jgi:hypothetical protein